MFNGFKVRHREHKEKPLHLDPEIAGALVDLLLKIVGATVKDRIQRGILVAAITGFATYLAPSWSPEVSLPEQQERPESQPVLPNNACYANRLDWPRTEAVH